MKILIVAATNMEVQPFSDHWATQSQNTKNIHLEVLITGVGLPATIYALTVKLMQHKYDLVLQAGVCGSFDRDIPLGSLVNIVSERYGDLGAEDHDNYIDIFDLGLLDAQTFPFSDKCLLSPGFDHPMIQTLQRVTAITVNTISGSEKTIQIRAALFNTQVESMEGLGLHYVCLQQKIPFVQIRAISNYVTPRDRSSWKMKEAVINLNAWLKDFTDTL